MKVTVINAKKVLGNEQLYHKTFDKYYNAVVEDFNYRQTLLKVLFPSGEKIPMKVSKFLVNMVMWKPFVVFKKEISEDFLFETSDINSDKIAYYLDLIIDKFLTENNQEEVNFVLADIIKELGYFSLDFNKKIGNSISLYDLIQLSKNNEEFRDIIYTRYDENNINTSKIEKDMQEKTSKLLKILGENENCLQDYVNCKEGLNKNQVTQLLVNVGPKPDLKGNVYPKIVNTNFLTNGMQSASDYFINSSGGRKSAITNHSKVKSSGYLMRKLSILCMNVDLDLSVFNCKSKNYEEIILDSKKTMERFNGRYFLNEKTGKLKLFKYEDNPLSKNNDSEEYVNKYLGKTLKFRSPITCACKDGKVCKVCYGTLSKLSREDFQIHIGLIAILILTSQITQMQLSTKHLLKTSTKKIDWNSHFTDLFTLNGNTLSLNQSLDMPSKYSLLISEDSIFDNEDGLEDENSNEDEELDNAKLEKVTKYFRNCTIKYKQDKVAGRKYPEDYDFFDYFPIENEVDIYLSPYFEQLLQEKALQNEDGVYELPLKYIQENKALFYIEIENNELSAIIDNITSLIDKKERLGTNTYNEMINKFIELTNDSGIKINAVHLEIIIKELIKSAKDILERPDYSTLNPEYQILRLSESIMNSSSIVTSLSFERIKEQLYKSKTYRKTGSSLFDNFFI